MTKTVTALTPEGLDKAIADATMEMLRLGGVVFATQTHVTWCNQGDGYLVYTAVLFSRPKVNQR
jgi:hypothetical protein